MTAATVRVGERHDRALQEALRVAREPLPSLQEAVRLLDEAGQPVPDSVREALAAEPDR